MKTKELIHELPISEVIGQYLSLNLKGRNFEGLCPFHPDTKPSILINDSKKLYKCFTCGAGGDAISFVMDFKRISYEEAINEIVRNHNLVTDSKTKPSIDFENMALNLDSEIENLVIENLNAGLEKKIQCLSRIFSALSPLGMSLHATERIIKCSRMLGLQTDLKFIIESYQEEIKLLNTK
jgi:DNA primase catalytic core